ncbi:MAG: ABC transporter ATP-binding protein [Planctomycetes bacterium]|nr:ABC transporter ATP-binding protein [Planctomycetota bacterium]
MGEAWWEPPPQAATGSMPVVLECRELVKVFRDFWLRERVAAIRSVSFQVQRGEVFGLLGPNGSGKSTTIKLILGLLFPSRGMVRVFGKPPSDVRVKAHLGYLPEETHLYPFLSGRETLEYYGRLFRLDKKVCHERIDMLLDMVGLAAVARRPVGEYSKGMQRRIGLAQALINDPDLLILDEPTSGLDPVGTRHVKDLILELRKRGKSVLISSHMLADLEELCTRVAILYGGRIRKQGTLDELLTDPASVYLRTEPLSAPTLRKIDELVRAEEGKKCHGVEPVRTRLETLFLRIIAEAEEEGAETAGALEGSRTARFLASEGAARARDGNAG